MASHEKKPRLCDTDLALAATMTEDERRKLLLKVTHGRGYPFYRSAKALYPSILSIASLVLLPPAETLKKTVARKCPKGRKGEIPGNQKIVEALREYAIAHSVTGVAFKHEPVPLGPRAGKRELWAPFIIQIDGGKFIPYFDPRGDNELTAAARAFIFSVNHTYIRLQDPTQYGSVGFVIFQFATLKDGSRKVIAHFDKGVKFWSDREIGEMVDAVYRTMDAIEAERIAEVERKAS